MPQPAKSETLQPMSATNPVLLMVATVGSDDAQIKFFKLLEQVLPLCDNVPPQP